MNKFRAKSIVLETNRFQETIRNKFLDGVYCEEFGYKKGSSSSGAIVTSDADKTKKEIEGFKARAQRVCEWLPESELLRTNGEDIEIIAQCLFKHKNALDENNDIDLFEDSEVTKPENFFKLVARSGTKKALVLTARAFLKYDDPDKVIQRIKSHIYKKGRDRYGVPIPLSKSQVNSFVIIAAKELLAE